MAASANNKKWMQSMDIYDPELDALLSEFNVNTEDDLKNLKEKDWNEIWRQSFVERVKAIKEQQAKSRLEKKMKKLEKLWRNKSGIKIGSATSGGVSQLDSSSASKKAENAALNEAAELKAWLRSKEIWMKDLFSVLVSKGVNGPDDFFLILDETMDEIKREVRVLRAQELKSNDAKMRLENILKKFEDEWRKSEGKEKKKKNNVYDEEKDEPPTPSQTSKQAASEALHEKGKHLKEWMRAQQVWNLALYEELISAGVTNPDNIGSIKQKDFNEIVRKVKVDRFSQLKSQTARASADKLLVKFEKLYKKAAKK